MAVVVHTNDSEALEYTVRTDWVVAAAVEETAYCTDAAATAPVAHNAPERAVD